MKKLDFWSSIFWLIISSFISLYSHKLGLGSLSKPGPGFFFFWGGVTFGILSIIVLISAVKSKKEDQTESDGQVFRDVNWIKVISVVISIILYEIILERLGFLISTFLLMAFLLYSIGSKRWYVVVFFACVSSFLSYSFFVLLLKIRLPKGLFWI